MTTSSAAIDPANSMADNGQAARAHWMGVFARARPAALAEALGRAAAALGGRPSHHFLRAPEIGAVMVQGRAGGTGAPFNQGEMTVTRTVLVLADGTQGHAWVPGRDRAHAIDSALADALMQRPDSAPIIRAEVLEPLHAAEQARAQSRREKAAATRVDFFTMVRGEDE